MSKPILPDPYGEAVIEVRQATPADRGVALRDGEAIGAALGDAPGYRQSVWHQVVSGPPFGAVRRGRVPHALALERAFHAARPPGQFWYLATLDAWPRATVAAVGPCRATDPLTPQIWEGCAR